MSSGMLGLLAVAPCGVFVVAGACFQAAVEMQAGRLSASLWPCPGGAPATRPPGGPVARPPGGPAPPLALT
jgi:hypothetical protein